MLKHFAVDHIVLSDEDIERREICEDDSDADKDKSKVKEANVLATNNNDKDYDGSRYALFPFSFYFIMLLLLHFTCLICIEDTTKFKLEGGGHNTLRSILL